VSQEESIVQGHFDAASRGDFAAVLDAFDEDVVLVVREVFGAGTFRGRDVVGKWFGDWFRSFADGYCFEIEEIRGVGERVSVVACHHGRGRASGVELERTWPYAYTVRSGKIVRIEIFEHRAEALKAVGLEE